MTRAAAKGSVGRKSPTPAKRASTKVTPVRLTPKLRQGLEMLHDVLKKPINKLVNEAVGDFVRKRAAELEADYETLLEQVKAYRRLDPDFRQAIRLTAEAEAEAAAGAAKDPAQGTTYVIESRTAGPAQSRVRELLRSR
jgi:hypothetical protein